MIGPATAARFKWITGVVRDYSDTLFRYALSFTRSETAAQEAVQEVFVELSRAEEKKVRAHLRAWLFCVCRRRAIDQYRSSMRTVSSEDAHLESNPDSQTPEPDAAAALSEEASLALALIDQLSEQQQEIVRLKFLHQLSYREIAEATDLKVSNVGVHLHQALKKLRASWKELQES